METFTVGVGTILMITMDDRIKIKIIFSRRWNFNCEGFIILKENSLSSVLSYREFFLPLDFEDGFY